jgi:hypothetical protein
MKRFWKSLPENLRYLLVAIFVVLVAMGIVNLIGLAAILFQGARR